MDVPNSLYSANFNRQYFKDQFPHTSLPITKNRPNLSCDRIFIYLIKEGIINSFGQLTHDFEKFLPPELKSAQINRFNSIFSTPRILHVLSLNIHIKFSLGELFQFLNINEIEIVGGSLFWILGAEYMRRLSETLHLPDELFDADFFDAFEKPAADIDIRVLVEPDEDPADFIESVSEFFQQKIPKYCQAALKEQGFTKFHNRVAPETKEQFSIISFKTEDNDCFDLVFIKQLARNHLFEHDALKIEAHYFNHPFRTLKLGSNNHSLLRPLLLKMTKILDANQIENINISGACMFISYLAKGWRYDSTELQEKLFLKLLSSKNLLKIKKNFNNHFPQASFAPLIFCFYISYFLPKNLESDIKIIIRSLLLMQRETIGELKSSFFKEILACVEHLEYVENQENSLIFMTLFLQIFGHLSYLLKSEEKKCEIDAIFREVNGSNNLQLKFNATDDSPCPLYFTMQENLIESLILFKEAVEKLKEKSKEELLPLFQSLIQFIEIDFTKTILKQDLKDLKELENAKSIIFKYLESKEQLLRELGFYLLSLIGIQEESAKYIPNLIKEIPKLLANEINAKCRKNLFHTFLHYWRIVSHKELENNLPKIETFCTLISQENYPLAHLKKDFVLCFAPFKNPLITSDILNLLAEKKKLLNDDEVLQLAKAILTHSSEPGLKILEIFLMEQPLENARTLLTLVLNTYQERQNTLFFNRDALKLASITALFLGRFVRPKILMKKEEGRFYLKLAHEILNQDFLKGLEFLNLLEEKKVCIKGFQEILKEITDNEKTLFLLKQHKNIPIDYVKASGSLLEERLSLLLSCHADPDTEQDLYNTIREELCLFLIGVIRNAKTISKSFKNKFDVKLEWVLIFLLENPNYLMDYFKICKEFNPQIALKNNLLKPLSKCAGNLSLEDQKNPQTILAIHEHLTTLEAGSQKRTVQQYSENLVIFYKALSDLSLQGFNPEIAGHYVQNIITYIQFKGLIPDNTFLILFDRCLALLLEKGNIVLASSLVKKFEKAFLEVDILNKKEHWKNILLNSQENSIDLAASILQKKTFFKNDPEMKEKAEVVASMIFCAAKINEAHFESAFELVKAYGLTNKNIYKSIVVALTKLKNKKLAEETFFFLLDQNHPLTRLTPLFELFVTKFPEACHLFVSKIPALIEKLNEDEDQMDKQYLLFILERAVLSIIDDTDYLSFGKNHDIINLISAELEKYGKLSPSQHIEILLDHIKAYRNSLRIDSNIICWKYLRDLIENPDIKPYLAQVLPLFATVFETSLKSSLLENNLNYIFREILPYLYKLTDASNFKFLAQSITKNSSYHLVKVVIQITENIIKLHLAQPTAILKEPFLTFKIEVKKLFSVMLQQRKTVQMNKLFDLFQIKPFFTDKEITNFAKEAATVYLDDPVILKEEILIESALDFFLQGITEPLEPGSPIIKQALTYGLTLAIKYKRIDLYDAFLVMLSKKLFSWMGHDLRYTKFLSTIEKEDIYGQALFKKIEPIKLNSELFNRAKDNCYQFLFYLTECTSTLSSIKEAFMNAHSEKILIRNFDHLCALIFLFPERRSEIIQCALNFRKTAAFCPNSRLELITSYSNHVGIFMMKQGFFNKIDKKLEEIFFKLSIYAGFGPDISKFSLTHNAKCNIIYKVIREISSLDTFRSLLMAYGCFILYQTEIKKINKTVELMEYFTDQFKKLYPNETKLFSEVVPLIHRKFKETAQIDYPETEN